MFSVNLKLYLSPFLPHPHTLHVLLNTLIDYEEAGVIASFPVKEIWDLMLLSELMFLSLGGNANVKGKSNLNQLM